MSCERFLEELWLPDERRTMLEELNAMHKQIIKESLKSLRDISIDCMLEKRRT